MERFQELGHGVEFDPDANRNVYIASPCAELCHVTSCSRQGTLSYPALPVKVLGQMFTPGPGTAAKLGQR